MATVTEFPIETTEVAFTGNGALVRAEGPTISAAALTTPSLTTPTITSPAVTGGTFSAPTLTNAVVGTQSPGNNSTLAASTAYVEAACALVGAPTLESFSVHKNSTNQTSVADVTDTQVTFSTEVYDVGSKFASNAWTPSAGKVSMRAAVYISGTAANDNSHVISIYKNGSPFRYVVGSFANAIGTAHIAIDDIANGTDVYTVYVLADVDSGTATIGGLATQTYFMGHRISA